MTMFHYSASSPALMMHLLNTKPSILLLVCVSRISTAYLLQYDALLGVMDQF